MNSRLPQAIVLGIVMIAVAALTAVALVIIFDATPDDTPSMVTMILGSAATVITGLLAYGSASRAAQGTQENKEKLDQVHESINGRMTELLKQMRKEGVEQGRAEERARIEAGSKSKDKGGGRR